MKNLPYVSILLLGILLGGCASVNTSTVDPTVYIQPADTVQQFRLSMMFGSRETTGILSLKYHDGWQGNVMNEFGINIFDFTIRGNKCRLSRVLPYINKWYIRQNIAKDFSYLLLPSLRPSLKGRLLEQKRDTIRLSNQRFHVVYSLNRMKNEVTE